MLDCEQSLFFAEVREANARDLRAALTSRNRDNNIIMGSCLPLNGFEAEGFFLGGRGTSI